MSNKQRRQELARLRQQRRRERQQLMVLPSVTEQRDIVTEQSITHDVTPQLSPSNPTPSVTVTRPWPAIWSAAGQGLVGAALIGTGLTLAYTSMRANAWFGHELSRDPAAGEIFSTLSVTAEFASFVLPTANRLYRQRGEGWAAVKGWGMTVLASSVVFFAASGFVLTNVSERATAKAERVTPAIAAAEQALADAKSARDRECVKVGPVCRQREDAVVVRGNELVAARAVVVAGADPQSAALGVDPRTLRMAQAGGLVGMCLLAGLIFSHGWGLIFRR